MGQNYNIVILSDGETFSGVMFAKVAMVNQKVLNALHNDVRYRWIASGERGYDKIKSGILREVSLMRTEEVTKALDIVRRSLRTDDNDAHDALTTIEEALP